MTQLGDPGGSVNNREPRNAKAKIVSFLRNTVDKVRDAFEPMALPLAA